MLIWLATTIIGFIPVWIWPALAVAAIVSNFFIGLLTVNPFFKSYKIPLELLTFVIFTLSVFLTGVMTFNTEYQKAVQEYQAKIAAAEAASQKTNTVIQKVYVDRIKTIHDTQTIIKHDLATDASKIDQECKIDPVVIIDLNKAAQSGAAK